MNSGVIILAAALACCTPAQKQEAKAALDIGRVACIIANQALSSPEVAAVCDVAGPLFGPMEQVLTTARSTTEQTMRAARVVRCGDGGAP